MIHVHEITKTYSSGKRSGVKAVNRLSFSVQPGETYGLLGPNGAGKTTTLRIVMGLLNSDSGYVEIDGCRSDDLDASVRQRLTMISTNDGVYQWLTGREMLSYFADIYSVPVDVAASRIDELSRLLDFEGFVDQRCATLSTGQRQRIILARGMMHDPPVILLDEPTRGLDVIGSRVVFDFIQHLRENQKAILISTHRLDEAERFCDRFGLLHQGHLLHEGSMDELREQTGCDNLVDMFNQLMLERNQQANDEMPNHDANPDHRDRTAERSF